MTHKKHNENYINDYIYVIKNKEFVKINLLSILYIKAEGNFVKIITYKKNYYILSNLTQFTKQLPIDSFYRVHKSWTVNTNKIDKYTKEHLIINNNIIPLGATYKNKILNHLTKYSILRNKNTPKA